MSENALIDDAPVKDTGHWVGKVLIEKFEGEHFDGAIPYETVEIENLLMYGGVSCLWQTLLGNGTATAGQALTYFSNTQAAIGVGDSSTAAAAGQTDLQAASNKLRKGMNATYPLHTDGVVVGAATIQFQATFATAEANFAWQEIVIANSATAGTGRILNRAVSSLGTKTSASSWQITISVTIA